MTPGSGNSRLVTDGEQKAEPNPGEGVMHAFDCTHDPCKCLRTEPRDLDSTPEIPTLRPEDWALSTGVTCVSCPDCAFTFDARHTEVDSSGGMYDCPACFAHKALYLRCHLCGQTKWASTPQRATYLLAFHMDRRHKGWSTDGGPNG